MDVNVSASNYNSINSSQNQSNYEIQASKPINHNENNITKIIEGNKNNKSDKKGVKEEDVIAAIEKANKNFQTASTEFRFSVHEATKQIMIKVIDKETKKVIQEFPPENILDMVARSMEAAGLIVDKKL